MDHLQEFLLEMGRGFCFEARQKRIVIDDQRELYRIFLRTGGAPHKRAAQAFDKTWEDGALPYRELLGPAGWNLASDPEVVAIIVDGKPCKCAVAHNLGRVRNLLEGDYKNYDVVRLMA